MLQVVQARCVARYACEGRHPGPELLHQFQQVQNFLLEDVPSLDRFLT